MDKDKILNMLKEHKELLKKVEEMESLNSKRQSGAERISKAQYYNWRKQGLEPIIEALEYCLGLNTDLERSLESYKEGIQEDMEETSKW